MVVPERFVISVSEEQLRDLRSRLANARVVPNEVAAGEFDPNGSWAYGCDRETLQEYVKYWLEKYDWREQERKLNSLLHFTMTVRNLRMHFIHERSEHPAAIPLLLLHGWPGSVVEFLKVIPALKAAGFHVVAPSIPGYGWSEAPTSRGANARFMADHMNELMQELGYTQYVAQGGDWGSIILAWVAHCYPQNCVAYHSNMCIAAKPPTDLYAVLKVVGGLLTMSSAEWAGLKSTLYFQMYETAYQKLQGSKPQSLSAGLNDSPIGLLAWMLEKFQSWTDCGAASPERSGLTKDEILTNVMVYWVTQTIASSFRLYYETLGHAPGVKGMPFMPYVAVPTGVLWANDLYKFPRFACALNYNLKYWSTQDKGGHFFAFEQPATFVEDVTHFFTRVIDFEECKRSCPKLGQGRPLEPGRVLMYIMLGTWLASTLTKRLRSRL